MRGAGGGAEARTALGTRRGAGGFAGAWDELMSLIGSGWPMIGGGAIGVGMVRWGDFDATPSGKPTWNPT